MTTTLPSTTNSSATNLPEGWRIVRFDQMAQNITDRVDNPSEANVDRYVGLEHLDPESLKIRRWGKPDDVEATKLRFQPGDIIFGKRRFYQRKLAVADFEGICSAHALVLRAREDSVVKDFLPFFMQSETFFERAMSISVGSLSPTINWTALARQEFAIPPKDEQRRIADILWAADDACVKDHAVLEAAKSVRNEVFENLIQDGLRNADDGRWVQVNLKDLLTASPESGYSANPAGYNTGFYVLALSALTTNGYSRGHLKPVKPTHEVRATNLRKGDILISRSNTLELVGFAGIFDEDRDDVSFPDTMMRLHVDPTKVDSHFLVEFLLSNAGRKQIMRLAAGTSASMKKINRTGLSSLQVPLPHLDIQHRLMQISSVCTQAQVAADARLRECQTLRKALIERLISYAG
jgi:type I restriction enzyme, S subunit